MAYSCSNNSCQQLPYFSADGYFYNDIPFGDSAHDNARNLREKAPTVAGWR